MKDVMTRLVIGFAVTLAVAAVAVAAEKPPEPGAKDPAAMCAEMMKDGASPEGQKAMRDFMQSDRAPQAMANMMEMARGMGNGDVMLGMTRMMEMMGSMGGSGGMGGMMGGHGAQDNPSIAPGDSPGGHQPIK